ncbi:uncharacterized protein EV154DRAFT_481753 [Mucor mucedo]|uniref:uncharacterized protein n=1 Tax=Mucor mucedo TaxID=29922 RepID=UPI002220DB10|nr:uncharacterized protein EV154DRAFT_481753 [Mucor mucedo]KAI7890945.1 hypothetical protein EV154DRAFT_481753 [Mucor mucedo]
MKVQPTIVVLACVPGLCAAEKFDYAGLSETLKTFCGNDFLSCWDPVISKGVFFGDFAVEDVRNMHGSLAVQGNLDGKFGAINKNNAFDCSDANNVYSEKYGLVVGGRTHATVDHVYGASYFQKETDISRIRKYGEGCPIFTDQGTGFFDFKQAHTDAIMASMKLSVLHPTLKMDENDVLTRLHDKENDFDVITMNTCNDYNCHLFPGMLSDATHIISGRNIEWKTSQGETLPQTLIVNVPISVGTTFTLSVNPEGLGNSDRNTIYNFYPSNEYGIYTPGRIHINRHMVGQTHDFTLAPDANIQDIGIIDLSGVVVANDYHSKNKASPMNLFAAPQKRCIGPDCMPESLTPISTITYSTIYSDIPDTVHNKPTTITIPFSTITQEIDNTITYSTIYEETSTIHHKHSIVTEVPVNTVVYKTIYGDVTDQYTYSTVTDDINNTEPRYLTIYDDTPGQSIVYNTIVVQPSIVTNQQEITIEYYSTLEYQTISTEVDDESVVYNSYSTVSEFTSHSERHIVIYSDIVPEAPDSSQLTYSFATIYGGDTGQSITHSTVTDTPSTESKQYSTITYEPSSTITHSTVDHQSLSIPFALVSSLRNEYSDANRVDIPTPQPQHSTVTDTPSTESNQYSTITYEPSSTITHSTVDHQSLSIPFALVSSLRNEYSDANRVDIPTPQPQHSTVTDYPSAIPDKSSTRETHFDTVTFNTITDIDLSSKLISDVTMSGIRHRIATNIPRDTITHITITDIPHSEKITHHTVIDIPNESIPRDTATYRTLNDIPHEEANHRTIADITSNEETPFRSFINISDEPVNYRTINDTPNKTVIYNGKVTDTPVIHSRIEDIPSNTVAHRTITNDIYDTTDGFKTLVSTVTGSDEATKSDIPRVIPHNDSHDIDKIHTEKPHIVTSRPLTSPIADQPDLVPTHVDDGYPEYNWHDLYKHKKSKKGKYHKYNKYKSHKGHKHAEDEECNEEEEEEDDDY